MRRPRCGPAIGGTGYSAPMSVRLLHRVAAHPLVYDWIQRGAGYAEVSGRVARCLPAETPATVLDVGAGTGNLRRVVPGGASYIWLDNDLVKLNGFLAKGSRSFAMLADASRLAVRDRGVDYIVCVDVSHHLTDDQLAGMMREFARVVRRQVVFVDAVKRPDSVLSRILWGLDRGSQPRTEAALLTALGRTLRVERVERFTVYHTYLLCVARPL